MALPAPESYPVRNTALWGFLCSERTVVRLEQKSLSFHTENQSGLPQLVLYRQREGGTSPGSNETLMFI